jgi:hypothetical protein
MLNLSEKAKRMMAERFGYTFGAVLAIATCAGWFYAGVKYQQVVVPWIVTIQEDVAKND